MYPATHASVRSNCVFYPGLFNEALELLYDAHAYFQARGADEQASLPVGARLFYANEMTRITLRLTSIMAWLLVRKAVFAGRIAEDEAQAKYPLEARQECLAFDADYLCLLPDHVGYLAERSYALFERVVRLEVLSGKNTTL